MNNRNKAIFLLSLVWVIASASPTQLQEKRSIQFLNRCPFPVWLGISSSDVQNMHPRYKGDSSCNSDDDCYSGSVCRDVFPNPKCFWQHPKPENLIYRLEASNGTTRVDFAFFINGYDIAWEGAVAARTNCVKGICETGGCGEEANCPFGKSFSYPATEVKLRLSKYEADQYEITIYKGLNVPIGISPSLPLHKLLHSLDDPYECGSAGICSWLFKPPSDDYQWVSSSSRLCSSQNDCNYPEKCGISYSGDRTSLLQKNCGRLLGYWTAQRICEINPYYGAPFNCAESLPGQDKNLALRNLQWCIAMKSCYAENAKRDCCGCADWDQLGLPVPPFPATNHCGSTNVVWEKKVLPTLFWLKKACPSAFVYPYDNKSSTFYCESHIQKEGFNVASYTITFCPNGRYFE